MDSFRELAEEPETAFGSHAPEPVEVTSSEDERRMQVRAYNYWTSLLAGRDFPSIEDLEPASIADFAKNSVLLDFTSGPANPTMAYVGPGLRRECDLDAEVESLSEVPSGSLLARLGNHYEQILETRAPVGVEAEFVNQRGQSICYRGILMPFSSDGDTIDFVYGVFNWEGSEATPAAEPGPKRVKQPINLDAPAPEHIAWEDGPLAENDDWPEPQVAFDSADVEPAETLHVELETPHVELETPHVGLETPHMEPADAAFAEPAEALNVEAADPEYVEPVSAEIEPLELSAAEALDDPVAVTDEKPEDSLELCLAAARATAEDAKLADGRSRHALYQALSQAYDFACAAVQDPPRYEQLLVDNGITVQARAPMTAVAKLVFGSDYDKARLTEYAAALSYAARQGVTEGGFLGFIEEQPGGLKGLVEAERRIRRPDAEPPAWREQACAVLREARPRPLEALAGNGEFALVLVRRDATGEVAPVAAVQDPALLERALRKATS